MENNDHESHEEESTLKTWLEDNLRILLSILIVVAIAGGIYSYSSRTQSPSITDVTEESLDTTGLTPEEKLGLDQLSKDTEKTPDSTDKAAMDKALADKDAADKVAADKKAEADKMAADKKASIKETPTVMKDTQVTSANASKETETSFIETAQRGEGKTHLARHAAANYLEKNPDSSLTVEHKIYIEDYLRKHTNGKGGIHIGTSQEFSKDLIKGAIESSKKLSDSQLKNLKKYSARAPSLK